MLTLCDAPFDPAQALKQFEAEINDAGAVVSFTGYVRPTVGSGQNLETVQTLYLQAYSPMTEDGISATMSQAKERWPLTALRVIHRLGGLSPCDPIVFVATASHHRRAAFESADFLMDYLKTRAIFWKRETTDQTSRWIEPRDQDYADSDRWIDLKDTQ